MSEAKIVIKATDNNTKENEPMRNAMISLLDEYDYYHTDKALDKILDTHNEQKANLRSILSKCQYWDEEMQAVVLKDQTIIRSFDNEGVREFTNWAIRELNRKEEIAKRDALSDLMYYMRYSFKEGYGNIINMEYLTSKEGFNKLLEKCPDLKCIANGQKWSRYIGKLLRMWGLNTITDVKTEIYTDSNTGEVRTRTKDYGYNYYFALLGDSINPLEINGKTFILSTNIMDYLTMSFGHDWASCHTIDKDNHRGCRSTYSGEYSSGTLSYALDNVTMIAYIVDEENEKKEGRNRYHKYGKEVPYYLRDKEHREVIAWDKDKLYFARVYPDGRDGGDEGIGAQFREIVQQIFAECLDVSNIWTTKKGEEATSSYVEGNRNGYTCYSDWHHCNDGAMSFLRRIDGILNEEKIIIGAPPICVSCGCTHGREDNIMCPDCASEYDFFCENCDEGICEDDDYIYVDDGHYFCCSNCARNAGYVFCADGEWRYGEDCVYCEDDGCYYEEDDDAIVWCEDECGYHLIENCKRCDGDHNWYYNTDDGVETYDGSWFHDEETAREAGYVFCDDDDEWHHTEE